MVVSVIWNWARSGSQETNGTAVVYRVTAYGFMVLGIATTVSASDITEDGLLWCDTVPIKQCFGQVSVFAERERAVRFRCCGLEFAPASHKYVYNIVLSKFWFCHPIINIRSFINQSVLIFRAKTTLRTLHYALFAICYIFRPFRQSSGRFYNIHGKYAKVEASLPI